MAHHVITVAPEVADGQRTLSIDGRLSHHLDETHLQALLQAARLQTWTANPTEGQQLGAALYDLFNGSTRVLEPLITRCEPGNEPLLLYFELPLALDALPVELLHERHFLALGGEVQILRRVSERNRLEDRPPEKRALRMLFMACSPLDLAQATLRFEQEEEAIFRAVAKLPIDITPEDSGSLQGLEEALIQNNGFDVVHLSGHAGHDAERGPVFYLEDAIGHLRKATPRELAEVLRDYPPQLLFLSGCSTGRSDPVQAAASFAQQLVTETQGPGLVLGWGLPVSDTGATRLTTELYRYLAQGKAVDFAVQRARQQVQDHYHPWPLLRLFTDGSPLAPLIAPGQRKRRRTERRTRYRALEDNRVRVLEYGFVGRRRPIQQGVQVLKGWHPEHVGVLIRGPAGVGKSCLAGKLTERVPDKALVVLHGELNPAALLGKLQRLFDRKGLEAGLVVLQERLEYPDRIKQLCREALKALPTILVLDDFEQNLKRHGDGWRLTEAAIAFLRPLLEALPWCEGESNLLITSRHPFALEVGGRDLPGEVLADITLSALRGPDLEKKKQELPHIAKSAHSALYLEVGRGNPRLQEWLEKIAEDEARYDLDALQAALQGQSDEFVRRYLAEILAESQGEAFQRLFREAAVYRQPLPQAAFAALGADTGPLEVGVDLTLFEKEQLPGAEPVYWVMPVIRDQAWAALPSAEQQRLHRLAYAWYDAALEGQEEKDPDYLAEAVHQALACADVPGACRHAIPLGTHLNALLLYRESARLQQQVAERIDEGVIQQAIADKDEDVAVLLNDLGETWRTLGDAKKAIGFFEQALQIDRAVFGDQHPNVAFHYNNLGLAYQALGDLAQARDYLARALAIFTAVYGEDHPHTRTVAANLAGLGD